MCQTRLLLAYSPSQRPSDTKQTVPQKEPREAEERSTAGHPKKAGIECVSAARNIQAATSRTTAATCGAPLTPGAGRSSARGPRLSEFRFRGNGWAAPPGGQPMAGFDPRGSLWSGPLFFAVTSPPFEKAYQSSGTVAVFCPGSFVLEFAQKKVG